MSNLTNRIIRRSNGLYSINPEDDPLGLTLDSEDTIMPTTENSIESTTGENNINPFTTKNFNSGGLNTAIGAAGSMAGSAISGGFNTGVGNAIQGLGNIASAIPGPYGAIAGAALNVVGGLTNRAFGSQINEQAVQQSRLDTSNQSNMSFNLGSNSDILNQSDFGMLSKLKTSDIGKDGWFANKANRLRKKLNKERNAANQQALNNYTTAVDNIAVNNNLNAMANYAAYGGPINMNYTGTMSPFGNRFDNGGSIFTDGGIFSNGITTINNGGTHESNPMEGVMIGVDQQGVPNLVEEGEVVFNDYVYSNRMKVPKAIRSKYKLRKSSTYADAAKKLSKESEERPNDPISQRGLEAIMGELASSQEEERFKKQMKDPAFQEQMLTALAQQQQAQEQQQNQEVSPEEQVAQQQDMQQQVPQEDMYAYGGKLGNIFEGEGDKPNTLNTVLPPQWVDEGILIGNNNIKPFYTAPGQTPVTTKDIKAASDYVTKATSVSDDSTTTSSSKLANLRYAPILGAAIGLGHSLFSKPDYSRANALINASNNVASYTPLSFTPLGDYMTYNPLDRNYYLNKLNAEAAAARRGIVNQSAGNRAAAMMGLLSNSYNAQSKLGDLARQAEEYNAQQREKVATFNRGTNQYNAEMAYKTGAANLEAAARSKQMRLNGLMEGIKAKEAIDAQRATTLNANLTNLFNSIGDVGRETYTRNMLESNPALYYGINSIGDIRYKGGKSNAYGGKLNRKKGGKHA